MPLPIGPFPFVLVNGTLADANQVMADFNWLLNGVNGIGPIGNTANPNKLLNPFMEIDQANEGAAVNPTNANLYVVDGLRASTTMSSGTATAQRTATAPTGYTYSATLGTVTASTSVAAGDQQSLSSPLEGDDLVDTGFGTAGAQSLTLSFWATATLSGTYYASVRNAAGNRSYVSPFTIATANTWQLFTITIPGDTAGTWVVSGNAVAAYVSWATSAGTNSQAPTANTWAAGGFLGITGMSNAFATTAASYFRLGPCKLEVGNTATPMLRQSFQSELSRCQRYYEKSYDIGTAVGAVTAAGNWFEYLTPVGANSSRGSTFVFRTSKRAIPSVTAYSTSTGASGKIRDTGAGADITPTITSVGTNAAEIYATSTAASINFNGQWVADARL